MDEKALVQAAKHGDTTAFDELIADCLPKLRLLLSKNYKLQDADMDDIIQEAMTKAWRKINNFRGDSAFLTWFYWIIRNEALNLIRSRKLIEQREVSAALTLPDSDGQDYDHILHQSLDLQLQENAQSILERKETLEVYRQIIEDVLKKLSREHQEIIRLVMLEGLSYKDISKKLNIPIGTVMSRLFFARRKAQKLINSMTSQKEIME